MRRRSFDPLMIMIRERFYHPDNIDQEIDPHEIHIHLHNNKNNTNSNPNQSEDSQASGDPFVSPYHSVFDIRIKRIITSYDSTTNSPLSNPAAATSPRILQEGIASISINSGSQKGSRERPPSFSHFHEIGSIDMNDLQSLSQKVIETSPIVSSSNNNPNSILTQENLAKSANRKNDLKANLDEDNDNGNRNNENLGGKQEGLGIIESYFKVKGSPSTIYCL